MHNSLAHTDRGLIFNIQHFSVHDGPGIRTLVFFKGCPLHCRWCSNPESQGFRAELGYSPDKCLRCGQCAVHCGQQALTLTPEGVVVQRALCATCLVETNDVVDSVSCAHVCPAGALTVYGHYRTVAEIMIEVEQDSPFYVRSAGGMTLSGGEALSQPGFALNLLREAKKRRIHCAMETCALASSALMLEACSLLDYLLVDVKCLDATKHEAWTGVSNDVILANIRAVRDSIPMLPIHVRTPVIPGFNDNTEDIVAIAAFARSIQAVNYELLPYHSMGQQKYHFLDLPYPMGQQQLNEALFTRLQDCAKKTFAN